MTGVFANNLEIACKASDGKSIASFPDPCFSPPAPSAGWIVIPYANTTSAKDTSNGSKTVFIGGKPVMLKDKSYFKTSTGNEAAAGPKGIASGVKKGKAYYASWSMDVKIEGLNACRHTDLMTHNHGSPANTGAWHFASQPATQQACVKDRGEMDKNCEISEKEQTSYRDRHRRINERRVKHTKKHPQGRNPLKTRDKTWKDKHCMMHLIAPSSVGNIKSQLKDFEKKFAEYVEDLQDDIAATVGGEVLDDLLDWDAIARCSRLRIPWLIAACKAAQLAHSAYVAYSSIQALIEPLAGLQGLATALDDATRKLTLATDTAVSLTPEQIEARLEDSLDQKGMADAQAIAAQANACLAARKCMLVSYKEKVERDADQQTPSPKLKANEPVSPTVNGKSYGPTNSNQDLMAGIFGLNNPYGCCPGQTGHHLVPSAWVKHMNCNNSKYNGDEAPVVCGEGTSHSNGGSHERLHTELDKALDKATRDLMASQRAGTSATIVTKDGFRKVKNATISMDEALEMAAEAHQHSFNRGTTACPTCSSGCSSECIRAQLEEFYRNCTGTINASTVGKGVPESGNYSTLPTPQK